MDPTISEQFQKIITESKARIYFKDMERQFVYANPATLTAMTRVRAGDLRGQRDEDYFSGEHVHKAKRDEEIILRGEIEPGKWLETYELETWKDELLTFAFTRKRAWLDSDGKICGLIGITHTIEFGATRRSLEELTGTRRDAVHRVQGTYLEELPALDEYLSARESLPEQRPKGPKPKHKIWYDEAFNKAFPQPSGGLRLGKSGRFSGRFHHVHPDDLKKVLEFMRNARCQGNGFEDTIVFRLRPDVNGYVTWVKGRAQVFEKGGERYLLVRHRNSWPEEVQTFFSRRILEKFPGYVFVKDREHRFRYINERLGRVFKLDDPRDAIMQTDEAFEFPLEQIEIFRRADDIVFGGQPGTFHITPAEPFSPMGRSEAELVTVKFQITDSDLEPWVETPDKLVLGLAWEIDEKWRAYHEEHVLWHAMLENTSDAIYIKTAAGKYLDCNTPYARLLGLVPSEVRGRTTEELWGNQKDLFDQISRADQQIRETLEPIHGAKHFIIPAGQDTPEQWLSTKLPVLSSDGTTVSRIIGILSNREIERSQRLIHAMMSERALLALTRGEPARTHSEIAIIFCDLRGFSALSTELADRPAVLVDLLKRYMDLVAELAKLHHLELDKFMGDGCLLFKLPTRRGRHKERVAAAIHHCVEFALDLDAKLKEVVRKWRNVNVDQIMIQPEIGIGIGIHVGPATVGLIEGGERMQYTVLGKTVNDTSRYEMLAGKHGLPPVLLSTIAGGFVRDWYDLTLHDSLKNEKMDKPLLAFSVRRRTPPV